MLHDGESSEMMLMFCGTFPLGVPQNMGPHTTAAGSSVPDKAVNVLQRMCKLQKRVQVWAENTSGT